MCSCGRAFSRATDPDAALAVLHGHCAPGAVIADKPVPAAVAEFLANIDPETRAALVGYVGTPFGVPTESTDTAYRRGVTYIHPDGRRYAVDYHITRDPPGPWLIHRLDIQPLDSS